MMVKIWGCRGSLPIPGKSTLRYGGNTSCIEVRLKSKKNGIIILDAGSGIRELGKDVLTNPEIEEVFLILSHSHWDHLMGFPFFLPAYQKKYTIFVRGGPIAKESVKKYLEHQMQPPFFPVPFGAMKAQFDFSHGIPMVKQYGNSVISPIPLSHPNGGYGFKIEEAGSSFIYLPDNELEYTHPGGRTLREYADFCGGANLLIHDAQYTPKEYETKESWGHSSFESAVKLGVHARVDNLGLFHHDPDHTDVEIDRIQDVSRKMIEKIGSDVKCFAVEEGMALTI